MSGLSAIQVQMEHGNCSDISFDVEAGLVTKTTRHDLPFAEASELYDGLLAYDEQLREQPIEVNPIRSVSLISGEGGFRVSHASDFVPGPSVARLEGEQQHAAVASILGSISRMGAQSADGNTLPVGADAKVQNWHIAAGGSPILVDTYPPLLRKDSGSLEVGAIPGNYRYYDFYLGTFVGAAAKVLYSSVHPEYPRIAKADMARTVMRGLDDWCYDALPADLRPELRDATRRQIRTRFVGLVAATAMRNVRSKLHDLR